MNARWNRRDLLAVGAALSILPVLGRTTEVPAMLARPIPASGEMLPVIGLGTYSVFDVDSTPDEIAVRRDIVATLLRQGGNLLDTSPMYNRSEKVIGDVIASGVDRSRLFLATKVWTDGAAAGRRQMTRSAELMRATTIDLMQVHNLRDTKEHMPVIRELQDSGKIRYSGLTHYTASARRNPGCCRSQRISASRF